MAPKKKGEEEVFAGVLVCVNVNSAQFVQALGGLPVTSLRIGLIGTDQTTVSGDASPSSTGHFSYGLKHVFKQPIVNGSAANSVLNAALLVTILSAGGEPLGAAEVDFAPLVLGAERLDLPAVEVALTPAGAALAGMASLDVTVELQSPPAADAEEGAGPTPLLLTTAEEAEGANIVSLQVVDAGPLPQGLLTAAAAAGGNLRLSAALLLPSIMGATPRGPPTVPIALSLNGKLRDGRASWSRPGRCFLSGAANAAFKAAMEDGEMLTLEVGRYLVPSTEKGFDNLCDPASEAYHAVAAVDASRALLQPATSSVVLAVEAFSRFGEDEALAVQASGLPPIPPPAPKAKAIEAAPVGLEGTPSSWAECGCSMQIRIGVSRPLMAAWAALPKPSRTLVQLIPTRDPRPRLPPSAASDILSQQMGELTRDLAAEYADLARAAGAATGDVPKALVYELNRRGKFAAMKEALRQSIVALVGEKYNADGALSAAALQDMYNDLYITLLDHMHAALVPPVLAVDPLDGPTLAALGAMAAEYEAVGLAGRAEAAHQERLANARDASVWFEYGAAMLRLGRLGRAEECLREALALEPAHEGAMLALAALSLHNGLYTDPIHFTPALAALHELRELKEGSPLVPALQAVAFTLMGDGHEGSLKSAAAETMHLSRQAGRDAPHGYVQAGALLVAYRLPGLAEVALGLARKIRNFPRDALLATELGVVIQLQGAAAGVALLKESERDQSLAAAVSRGDFVLAAGKAALAADSYIDAERLLRAALDVAPGACDVSTYLLLCDCYERAGEAGARDLQDALENARDVAEAACERYPCASSWLRAGRVHAKLGDLRTADLCLTEANLLDPRNAEVWTHLALLAAHSRRYDEAEQAAGYALKYGGEDEGALEQVVEYLSAAGHEHRADAVRAYVAERREARAATEMLVRQKSPPPPTASVTASGVPISAEVSRSTVGTAASGVRREPSRLGGAPILSRRPSQLQAELSTRSGLTAGGGGGGTVAGSIAASQSPSAALLPDASAAAM